MDQISYQNGFVCGMATKGLVRSGQLYQPIIYNDDGVYTYFYIDFRRAMSTFSFGMFAESIIVYDSVQISVTAVEKISASVYKVYANIANLPHGVTVINKKTSKLKFSRGESVPAFSIHMFVTGQAAYIDGGYCYEKQSYYTWESPQITDTLLELVLSETISSNETELVYITSAWEAEVVEVCSVILT